MRALHGLLFLLFIHEFHAETEEELGLEALSEEEAVGITVMFAKNYFDEEAYKSAWPCLYGYSAGVGPDVIRQYDIGTEEECKKYCCTQLGRCKGYDFRRGQGGSSCRLYRKITARHDGKERRFCLKPKAYLAETEEELGLEALSEEEAVGLEALSEEEAVGQGVMFASNYFDTGVIIDGYKVARFVGIEAYKVPWGCLYGYSAGIGPDVIKQYDISSEEKCKVACCTEEGRCKGYDFRRGQGGSSCRLYKKITARHDSQERRFCLKPKKFRAEAEEQLGLESSEENAVGGLLGNTHARQNNRQDRRSDRQENRIERTLDRADRRVDRTLDRADNRIDMIDSRLSEDEVGGEGELVGGGLKKILFIVCSILMAGSLGYYIGQRNLGSSKYVFLQQE